MSRRSQKHLRSDRATSRTSLTCGWGSSTESQAGMRRPVVDSAFIYSRGAWIDRRLLDWWDAEALLRACKLCTRVSSGPHRPNFRQWPTRPSRSPRPSLGEFSTETPFFSPRLIPAGSPPTCQPPTTLARLCALIVGVFQFRVQKKHNTKLGYVSQNRGVGFRKSVFYVNLGYVCAKKNSLFLFVSCREITSFCNCVYCYKTIGFRVTVAEGHWLIHHVTSSPDDCLNFDTRIRFHSLSKAINQMSVVTFLLLRFSHITYFWSVIRTNYQFEWQKEQLKKVWTFCCYKFFYLLHNCQFTVRI